ncbi:ArsO family NAD(P)H-dependent flavin-containing monooxygenase [Spirosoma flavum]|uniref:ArsO family NAD(P)H-dependent flavin-containing monooxygenase n=1 Tax=Spirosoma flavum TaxID=2048557 RepID=A0ABW6AVH0_9BACT
MNTRPTQSRQPSISQIDVIVIGGGQSGLAMGYFLRRTGLQFVILDEQNQPGGAWQHGWNSLRLFSPADASSLPGWPMPRPAATTAGFPDRNWVIDYLTQYESKYQLPIVRPVCVERITYDGQVYLVQTASGDYQARAVVNATGSWSQPYIPDYPERSAYTGLQLHSAQYRKPRPLAGLRTLIVGGGNSGAQILAEVSQLTQTRWVTEQEPTFLPDDVYGRILFQRATERYHQGTTGVPARSLGDIVMVPSVQDARSRGILTSVRPFVRMTPTGVVWTDGREEPFDAVIWCTGFRPATGYLQPLGILEASGKVRTQETQVQGMPGLWMVGYGSWTGFASATLIGVGRTARTTADQISRFLAPNEPLSTT